MKKKEKKKVKGKLKKINKFSKINVIEWRNFWYKKNLRFRIVF